MENPFTTLIINFFHTIGLHQWYYAQDQKRRACVRCGITQRRGYLTGKWINER